MNENDQDRDQLERRLAEQDLFRQALTAKQERLTELEAEVKYLRRTLNEFLTTPRPAYAPAPARVTTVPRRWQAAA